MSKNNVIDPISNNHYAFFCVGCNETHVIDSTKWQFNDDLENPTIKPSVLTWLDPNPKADPKFRNGKYVTGFRCHSYVTDGMIKYLDDCTHRLAGTTVRLLPVEKWRNND